MIVDCGFSLAATTKGALKYEQTSQDGVTIPPTSPADAKIIGTVYLRKAQVKGEPKNITIKVEYAE